MEAIFSFLPVLIFLLGLVLLDSFKLVRKNTLALCLGWGILAAILSYFLNSWLRSSLSLDFAFSSRYIAPFTEELLKSAVILYLVSRQHIGFPVDAAIYGFAAGTGFALAENMVYLIALGSDTTLVTWIVRGFGTALMHGGCTALFSTILISGLQRNKLFIFQFLAAIISAYVLHSAFNHFLVNPYIQTTAVIFALPLTLTIVFQKSHAHLQEWLEIEFSQEVILLEMIQQGKLSHTKAGDYLISLKKHFSPEMVLDLYCFLGLYLELSIKAKRNLMLKENGFQVIIEHDIKSKLTELQQLRKIIGKLGEMALQPLVRMQYRELWKLHQIENENR